MPKIPSINPLLQAWLLEGPLSAQVPAYIARLLAVGMRRIPRAAA